MAEYRGYKIERDRDHFVVTGPEGETWTEDTMREAEESIDFLEEDVR